MKLFSSILAFTALSNLAFASNDRHTNFVQTCNENGYASESFSVITEDGYVS